MYIRVCIYIVCLFLVLINYYYYYLIRGAAYLWASMAFIHVLHPFKYLQGFNYSLYFLGMIAL